MCKIRYSLFFVAFSFLVGCGSPEQTTIDQFFRAAKSQDGATMAAMSAVGAPGPIESWQFVEITSQSSVPFELPDLLRQMREAEKIRDDQLEEGRNYLVENREALDQIIPKLEEDSSYVFDGELGEVQKEWSRLVDERREKERAFQDLRRAVEQAVKLAGKSVMTQTTIESLDGEVAVTEALTKVTSREGDEKSYAVTLRKYDLTRPNADRPEPSRWVIVDIEEKASS